MNITKQEIDPLNAVIKVSINADDYQPKVNEVLSAYRKKSTIPGFRKGRVPIGMIRKQYGESVRIEEVNKLLEEALNTFLTEEQIDFLGNPIPKPQEDFSWDHETLSFEFELGLTPEFELDLASKNEIVQYAVVADDDFIDRELEKLQTMHGKAVAVDHIEEDTKITGTFTNEEKKIENKAVLKLSDLKEKTTVEKFLKHAVGDSIELKTKDLFSDPDQLKIALGLRSDQADDLDLDVLFTIEQATKTALADLDQELFDKLFSDGSVKTEAELRDKIKEDAEKQFQQLSDQQLLNSVTEHLIATTKFDLPAEFLQKWLATVGEKKQTHEQVIAAYHKSEKSLRYQLIKKKIFKENDIKVAHDELKDYAKVFMRSQMAQFGNLTPKDSELEGISQRILANEEEVEKLRDQLLSQKLMALYKEKIPFKTKKVTYDEFLKDAHK